MKLLRLSTRLIALTAVPITTLAQDGWVFSARPPIVVRFDGQAVTFRFTNTSDKPIHGVTLHTTKDRQTTSRVIIDTIEPHKTASVEGITMLEEIMSDATITCTNYLKPIKLPSPAGD